VAGQGGDSEGTEAQFGFERSPLGSGEGNASLEEVYSLVEGDGRDLIVGEVEGTYRVIAAEEIGDSKEFLSLAD
jgi:hypothetical protein